MSDTHAPATKKTILDAAPLGSYATGQPVSLIIKAETDLGFKVIVDDSFWGVLYYNEVFQSLEKNQKIQGYIKKQREDGKLDITLYKEGHKGAEFLNEKIVVALLDNDGFLPITKETDAEEIYNRFGASKKKFKIALGGLYKARKIRIEDDGIYLVEK